MPTITDDHIRAELDVLREIEPSEQAVRRATAVARPRRRTSGGRIVRGAAGAAVVAATATAVLALLPSSSSHRTAHGVLLAAAAAAVDQPQSVDGYRWTQVVDRWTYGMQSVDCRSCAALVTFEQRAEQWAGVDWRDGRRHSDEGRIVRRSGDEHLQRALATLRPRAYESRYVFGSGSLERIPFADLPTEPDALRELLQAAVRDLRFVPEAHRRPLEQERPRAMTADQARYELIRSTIDILASANITPKLRAALYGVLAGIDGARALGRITDPLGRSGEGVSFDVAPQVRPGVPATAAELRLVFDTRTGDMLSWWMRQTDPTARPAVSDPIAPEVPAADRPRAEVWVAGEEHLVVRTAQVRSVNESP